MAVQREASGKGLSVWEVGRDISPHRRADQHEFHVSCRASVSSHAALLSHCNRMQHTHRGSAQRNTQMAHRIINSKIQISLEQHYIMPDKTQYKAPHQSITDGSLIRSEMKY